MLLAIVAINVAYIAYAALNEFLIERSETPAQTEARLRARRESLEEESAASARVIAARNAEIEHTRARNRILCKAKSTCEKYGQVRQDCATAGDFNNCVRVKMGDEDYQEVGSCTSDGHVAGESEPDWMDCFFSGSP